MNEPWINPRILAGILGGIFGTLGAIVGILAGAFVPRGKFKKLTLGVHTFVFVLSFISFVVGVVAYLSGQPYGVWYGFGYTGLICTVISGLGFWVILKRARDAELRKSMSEDLMFGGNEKSAVNKKEKKVSDE